jgi:cardiolipin synthase
MITVLLDNRQPSKTIAWVLVLMFLPVIGIILYFFFGQNTRKERIISEQSMDQLTKRSMFEFAEQRNLQLPESHRSLINLFANQSLSLPFKDNEVEIFVNGYEFFPALLKAIKQAKSHIHIDIYIMDDDPIGNLIADALIDKAREGVEIRLIYDDVGSWRTKSAFFERMRNEGIEIHPFLPVRFPSFTSKVNYRNHRKIIVIDGQVGFIGGMNLALRYVKGTGKQPWRDTHLCVRGGAVYGLQRAFLIDWYFVDRTLITSHHYYPPLTDYLSKYKANNCLAQVVTSNPTSQWPDIMQGYVRILMEAKSYVYMESPYFLPTEPILFAMRTAAITGVDVRLMIPLSSDAKLVEWSTHSYVKEVIEAGVKVYFYKAGFNHSKLLVSDDFICTCGSTNIDFRSFDNNFEANVFFYDRDLALRMKDVYLTDEAESVTMDEVTSLRRTPFLYRLRDSLVRLLSPLL